MQNFDLFEKALRNYEKIEEIRTVTEAPPQQKRCTHTSTESHHGIFTCTSCGEIVKRSILHDREWRNYADSKRKDPNRVQLRKLEERSIFKDVAGLGFSNKIVSLANDLYTDVAKGSIYRGNCRRAIIFACIFHAYKGVGQPQTHEKLIKLFNLNRKSSLKGLKHVTLNSSSPLLRGNHITAKHLIDDVMKTFSASKKQKEEVQKLYASIKNRSSNLNRARPNSIAAGLIYYWITTTEINISLKEFAKKSSLSEITISKIAKEVSTIIFRRRNKKSKTT
jgi:transcription initiation factor TFIIIB Brf1 subunit/transcription initiation factor TFIIB